MMKRRSRHAFANAAVALLMSLAGGTALAVAGGGQHEHDMGAQSDESYPSSQAMDSSAVITVPAPDSSGQVIEGPAVISPPSNAASPTPSTEPRYVPETGDAQYGSKLLPYDRTFQASPPARFNDATGQ